MSKLLLLSLFLIALAWILSTCHVRKGPPLLNNGMHAENGNITYRLSSTDIMIRRLLNILLYR